MNETKFCIYFTKLNNETDDWISGNVTTCHIPSEVMNELVKLEIVKCFMEICNGAIISHETYSVGYVNFSNKFICLYLNNQLIKDMLIFILRDKLLLLLNENISFDLKFKTSSIIKSFIHFIEDAKKYNAVLFDWSIYKNAYMKYAYEPWKIAEAMNQSYEELDNNILKSSLDDIFNNVEGENNNEN